MWTKNISVCVIHRCEFKKAIKKNTNYAAPYYKSKWTEDKLLKVCIKIFFDRSYMNTNCFWNLSKIY